MLAPIAALAALAFIALPATASAKGDSLGTWKVTDGYLDQEVQWKSLSRHDDGCYTTTWNDSGTDDMSYSTVDPQKVKVQDPEKGDDELIKGGVEFTGTDEQHSTYDVSNKRDHPGDQCGPPIQKPPDTSGCGSVKVDGIFIDFLVLDQRKITPFGPVSDPFLFDDKCPSDALFSTEALDSYWKDGTVADFKHQDKVHLHGHKTDKNPDLVTGPGTDQLIGTAQTTTIHWGLTLKKVHRRRHR